MNYKYVLTKLPHFNIAINKIEMIKTMRVNTGFMLMQANDAIEALDANGSMTFN